MADLKATTLGARRRDRLRTLVRKVERDGTRLQFMAATLAIATIALAVAAIFPWDASQAYTQAVLCGFFVISAAHYRFAMRSRNPDRLGFLTVTLQIALLTIFLIAPNPFVEADMPPAMALREAGFRFLLIFVCLGGLTLSVRLALWLGLAAALAWSLAVLWVVMQPGTFVWLGQARDLSPEQWLAIYFDPNFVDLVDQGVNVVAMLIIGGIVAATVARSNHLAEHYTTAERARFNLARHFSPNMVDELATADYPFGPVRRQDVAVLFADIVGFTRFTQENPAEEVFGLLRAFHSRMVQVVFAHAGTVDNYMGDCIMATFGVPRPGEDDAARAILCAKAMQQEIRNWNMSRQKSGFRPIDVRVGCQYGAVVLGAIGSERTLSFAVVGDTCNVASRLEAMCRDLDADICVGAEVIESARKSGREDVLAGFVDHGEVTVRGRNSTVHAWIVPRDGGAN